VIIVAAAGKFRHCRTISLKTHRFGYDGTLEKDAEAAHLLKGAMQGDGTHPRPTLSFSLTGLRY